jgi:ABC-type multidrug transport system ATPase subunit
VTALLEADCIVKFFGDRRVLSSASLRAVPGECRVILGRNGSGKSTLLRIAAGILAADGGMIRFGDRRMPRARFADMARRGLFLLPDHDLFSASFPVARQLDWFRRRFEGRDVVESAERVGVAARLGQYPHELSGGELRRAELAAVLVRRPIVLFADEPYRGIQPRDAEELTRIFRELAGEGMAVIVTGHEVPTLLDLADHITWCVAGTTHELGPPDVAARHDSFRRDYLAPVRLPGQ